MRMKSVYGLLRFHQTVRVRFKTGLDNGIFNVKTNCIVHVKRCIFMISTNTMIFLPVSFQIIWKILFGLYSDKWFSILSVSMIFLCII